jgi:hypothetical protein
MTELNAHIEAASAEDINPEAGAVTFCLFCGFLLVFESDLSLRLPQIDEFNEWMEDEATAKQLLHGYIQAQIIGRSMKGRGEG